MQQQSFEEFVQQEHQKKVDHFISYLESGDRAPILKDVKEIFALSEEECKRIISDAVTQMAMKLL